MAFTHLHLHTSYSLLDGAGKIPEMVDRAKSLGQKSIAITDHGVMYGAIEFFKVCLKKGIKPIIGSEVYVVRGSRFERTAEEERYHLILLCENDIGYKNLIKIVSAGFTDGFYYKPRVDYEILKKYHEGIICLTACLAGEVPKALDNGQYNEAKLRASNLKNIFGDNNFFIEIQNHGISDELKIHPDLIRLSKDLNVPIVATNDCHYTLKEDSFAHECLLCLQTGKKLSDSNHWKYEKEKYYITSEDEMKDLFKFCPEAVENTQIIADRCCVHMEFTRSAYGDLIKDIDSAKEKGIIEGNADKFKDMVRKCEYHVPTFKIPDGFTNESYLRKLVDDGIDRKYFENNYIEKINVDKDVINNRKDYELDMIIKMGFVDYFLIVYDYIHFAKTHDIPVGPGRGSAVGSIVAYALDITDVDPIKFNLFFETFLNPELVSMPDIDTDFCVIGREDVINYVKERYGKSQVAQIVTFGTLAAKQVIKDMGRVQDVPLPKTTEIANLVATKKMLDDDKTKPTLKHMINSDINLFDPSDIEKISKLRDLYNNDQETKMIIDTAVRIEGIPRQASVHASGVLIAPEDISNFVPFARGKEELSKSDRELGKKASDEQVLVTEYDMKTLEELGLLKMDFLGLRNVTAIKDCVTMIKNNHMKDIDLKEIPYDDKDVYKMIASGDTLGIFQLESAGMTNFMKQLKPTVLEDLIAGISLFRPGPMQFIPKYCEGKRNAKSITYDTEKLKSILEPTYGCIVYQEQVMQIVQELAGYSLGMADQVRRIMSKKKPDKLKAEEKNFIYGNKEKNIEGCIARGVSEQIAKKIFDELTQFASYAFNKSHAAAYATLAYQTAYLKYYYKAEFFTSICNSVMFNRDKLAEYVGNVILSGIKILPVDINKSYDEFSVEGKDIRMGFAALKKVGANISYEIITEREKNGPYRSFKDAVKRIASAGGNKNAFEALIMCGAFDSFDGNRNQKMFMFPKIIETINNKNKDAIPGQMTIFEVMANNGIAGAADDISDAALLEQYAAIPDFSTDEKLLTEKEYTGIYLSGHPLKRYLSFINKKVNCKSTDFIKDEEGDIDIADGTRVNIVGIIDNVKTFTTKRTGEEMAILTLSDMNGSFDTLVFPKKYPQFKNELVENNIVYIEGKFNIDDKDDSGKIYLDNLYDIDSYIEAEKEKSNPKGVKLRLKFNDINDFKNRSNELIEILKNNKGNDLIEIILVKEAMKKVLKEYPVNLSKSLIDILEETFGKINLEMVESK